LFLGDADANNKDRAVKGRSGGTFKSSEEHPARLRGGERHWRAKLSADDVRTIRQMWRDKTATQTSIAARFSVNSATVSRIVRNEWRKEVA
jgi:hypothetical protein